MTSVDRATCNPTGKHVALRFSRSPETLLRVYVTILTGSGALLFAAILRYYWQRPPLSLTTLLAIAFFMGVSVFIERNRVPLQDGTEVSAEFLAHFLSGALLGPVAGFIVAAAGQVFSYQRGEWLRNLCFTVSMGIAGAAAAVAYWSVKDLTGGTSVGFAVAGLAGGSAYQVVNFLLFVPVMWLRKGWPPLMVLRIGFLPFLPFHIFFLAVTIGLIYSFNSSGSLLFFITLIPVLGLIYAFRAFRREKELVASLEKFSLEIASSMITALDMKDNYTARHSAAVAQYSTDIAAALGLSQRDAELAHLAGLLHDLGKISVPDLVLNTPDRLLDTEWEVVKAHPSAGRDILSNVTELKDLSEIILHHHERYDGQGYPTGLSGADIPLISRVVSIADAYSAMISDRPYRKSLDCKEAISQLIAGSGTQFDPGIVHIFIGLLESGNEDYRTCADTDFHLEFQKVQLLQATQ